MSRSSRSAAEKLKELQTKRRQLDAQIEKHQARMRTEKKKQDHRRAVLLGELVLAQAVTDNELSAMITRLIDQGIQRPRDRELFGLPIIQDNAPPSIRMAWSSTAKRDPKI